MTPAQRGHVHKPPVRRLMSVCTVVHFFKDFSCRQRPAIIPQNDNDFPSRVGFVFCWLTAPRWRCHFLLSNHPEPALKTLVLWEMNRGVWGLFSPLLGDKEDLRVCEGQFNQKHGRLELSCTRGGSAVCLLLVSAGTQLCYCNLQQRRLVSSVWTVHINVATVTSLNWDNLSTTR